MTQLPETDAVPSFARALVAAGALFVDEDDRILLVRPTYKEYWDIPGGYVEPGETPREACIRELHEELGLQPPIGTLLSVDWAPHPVEGDKVLFIFDGGHLSGRAVSTIRFRDGELDQFRFVAASELQQFTIDRLARRLKESLEARRTGGTAYLEQGTAPTSPMPTRIEGDSAQ